MKVMIVGGNQMKYFGSRYYAYASKLTNGFIRNNHTVVRFFDRDVARLSNVFRSRTFGVTGANERLLQQASSFQPDLILLIHADVIQLEALQRLRENHPSAKIAQITIDALFVAETVAGVKSKSHLMDATFVTTAGDALKKVSGGNPAYYIPNITDASMETGRAFDGDCATDLFFACGSFERVGGDPRKGLVDVVRARLPHINFDCTVAGRKGGLWGAEYMAAVAQSKCGLNLSRDRDGPLNTSTPEDLFVYSSDRVSHLIGNGVLTFTHSKFGLDELFNEDEMVFFDSDEGLADKVYYYLENDEERRRIAKNGWEKTHRDLNERLATQYIEDVLLREELSHPYIWPTEQVI
jgi:hypothetical protein